MLYLIVAEFRVPVIVVLLISIAALGIHLQGARVCVCVLWCVRGSRFKGLKSLLRSKSRDFKMRYEFPASHEQLDVPHKGGKARQGRCPL